MSAGMNNPPARKTVLAEAAPKPIGPYSQAVRSGDYVFLSGQIGIDPRTGSLAPTVEEQTARAMENLGEVLKAEGLGYSDVVQSRIYLANLPDFATVNGIYGRYFAGEYPARATVAVSALPGGALVEIEMVASRRS